MKAILCLLNLLLIILPIVKLQTQLLKFRPDSDSFTAEAGEDRRLECVYQGLYTGNLLWNGPAVGSGRTGVSGNGVTRSILTISNVHLTDAGVYVCSRHSNGVYEEVRADLVVIDDPELLDAPPEQSLISGTNAVVQCQAYLGHPPATLLWFKDGSTIDTTPGSRFSVDSDGLHIQNVGMQDRGEYRCFLERLGWGTQLNDIAVEVLPAILCINKTMHPIVEVLYNETLNIDCMLLAIAGCEQANAWWVKPDGTIVRKQTLHQEPPHSPGIYSCFAHHQNGADRYDAVLDIKVPPLPPTSKHTVRINEGQTVVLSTDLSEISNPSPTYTWQSEGGASFPMEQEGQRVYITEEGTLVIRDCSVEDSGTYRCTVQNEHGMSVQTVNLHVVSITPPSLARLAHLTLDIINDCEDTDVTELTQQIVSELWTLCSCNVSVIDDSLECNSASEGNYTAIVLSQSEDAESLVEEYYEALVEAIQGEVGSDSLVLPIATTGGVGSLVLGIIIIITAITVGLRFRMRISSSKKDHIYDEIPYDNVTSYFQLRKNPAYAGTTAPTRAQHVTHVHTVDQSPELTSDDSLVAELKMLPMDNGENPEVSHAQGQNEHAAAPPSMLLDLTVPNQTTGCKQRENSSDEANLTGSGNTSDQCVINEQSCSTDHTDGECSADVNGNKRDGVCEQDPTDSMLYDKYLDSYEQCGDNYEHLQTYEQASDQYDQVQNYERRGSVYEEVQHYEKPCDGYDHIQQYELISGRNPA